MLHLSDTQHLSDDISTFEVVRAAGYIEHTSEGSHNLRTQERETRASVHAMLPTKGADIEQGRRVSDQDHAMRLRPDCW